MEEFLNKYRDALMIVVIALVLCYGTYTYVYKPKMNEINNLTGSLRMINLEIRSEKGGDMLLKDPNQARDLLQQSLAEIAKRVPSETDVPYILHNFVSIVGKNLSVSYNLIQPGNVVDESNYKRLPLRIEMETDYGNLNAFLSQLKNLPVTARVDELTLTKVPLSDRLSVAINLSMFLMPGGSARPDVPPPIMGRVYDPFYMAADKPLVANESRKIESSTGLKYSGYWIGREFRAIINDTVVKAGEKVLGYTVVKISKEKVVVSKDKKIYDVMLEKNR
jgi:Tfp pilus assembly protein PilO